MYLPPAADVECPVGFAGSGSWCCTDSDADGWPDVQCGAGSCVYERCQQDNCPTVPNSGQENADGDGMGDACDTDSDNDNVSNTIDNCPKVANPTQV